MERNDTDNVSDVWSAYSHNQTPTSKILELARDLLSGQIIDNTGGATHFYSPKSMPRVGDSTNGRDVRGGLEQRECKTGGGIESQLFYFV